MNAKPVLMDFAGVEIVAPHGWPQLTGRQWADVEAAMILQASNQPRAASAVILDFEERIGTRPAHRKVARYGVEALHRDIGRANRQRVKAERERVRQLQAPWKPPAYEAKPLNKALRKLASGDAKQAKEAVGELVNIEESHRDKIETLRIAAEQSEIRTLAEGRGEVIEVEKSDARGHKGRLRYTRRDGLEHLYTVGSLTEREYKAGRRYRELYERTDPERGLRPADLSQPFSPSHGGEGFSKKAAEWSREKLNIEAKVIEESQNRYALLALQEVAGQRRQVIEHLRDIDKVGSGHACARYVKGLREALRIAADHFTLGRPGQAQA
jgi:hypothetical protein